MQNFTSKLLYTTTSCLANYLIITKNKNSVIKCLVSNELQTTNIDTDRYFVSLSLLPFSSNNAKLQCNTILIVFIVFLLLYIIWIIQGQPWEPAAAFGKAIVYVFLHWF